MTKEELENLKEMVNSAIIHMTAEGYLKGELQACVLLGTMLGRIEQALIKIEGNKND